MRVLVLLPEALVTVAAAACLFAASGRIRSRLVLLRPALLAAVALALLLELTLGSQLLKLFEGGYSQDRFALFAKLALLLALLLGLGALDWAKEAGSGAAGLLLAALGGMVAASGTDLLTLWLGAVVAAAALLVSSPRVPVVLARRRLAIVGGGSAASALGMALLYGLTGYSRLGGLQRAAGFDPLSAPLAIALGLLFAGLLALLLLPWLEPPLESAEPAGFAPAGALAISAGSVALVILKLAGSMAGFEAAWAPLFALLAALLVTLGGLAAVAAPTLSRLLGALALTQLGWLVASALTPYALGVGAGLFLLGAYLMAAVGAGRSALLPGAEGRLGRLAGLAGLAPYRAGALALVMLSLAGAPPLGGWFGQFTVGVQLSRYGFLWLVGLGAFGSALATFAVLRALRLLFLEPLPLDVARGRPQTRVRLLAEDVAPALAAALTAAYGLFAYPIHSLAVQGGTALLYH